MITVGRHLCIVSVLFFLLAACGPVQMRRPADGYDNPRQLLDTARALRSGMKSFRIAGSIDHVGEHRVRGQVYLFSELPDRLRIDVLSPFGSTLSVLTSDGGLFGLSDHKSGAYFKGKAEPCNVARFIGLPLPLEDVVSILVGWTPLISGRQSLEWDDKGYWVVTVEDEGFVQKLHFGNDKVAVPLLRSVLYHDDEVVVDVKYDAWRAAGEHIVPFEIHISMPGDGAELFVKYDSDGVEFDVEFPDDAFKQTYPSGVEIKELTCP